MRDDDCAWMVRELSRLWTAARKLKSERNSCACEFYAAPSNSPEDGYAPGVAECWRDSPDDKSKWCGQCLLGAILHTEYQKANRARRNFLRRMIASGSR